MDGKSILNIFGLDRLPSNHEHGESSVKPSLSKFWMENPSKRFGGIIRPNLTTLSSDGYPSWNRLYTKRSIRKRSSKYPSSCQLTEFCCNE